MGNWIDLSNLPKRADGKISWRDCNHNLVTFSYRGKCDSLFVEKRIDEDRLLVTHNGNQYELPIISLQRVSLGKLFGFSINNNYHYDLEDVINDASRNLIINDKIRIEYSNGRSSKGYLIKCLDCLNSFRVSEANLDRGDGCPYCTNHKITVGENDIGTTRPDLIKMLKNKEDAYKYTQFSNQQIEFICPQCGEYLGQKTIFNVTRSGISCPKCSNGISYPNRLMYNLLSILQVDFTTEVVFDWCVFPNYYNEMELSSGRYDFVIDADKIIIEMDGGFGHGNDPHPLSSYTKEELIYRDKMKDRLAMEHGYKVIRIDCNYKTNNRFSYCMNNIFNSDLSNIYNLSIVDTYALQNIEQFSA